MSSRQAKHVAIIMDGNGRWAKQRGLPRVAGHKAGLEAAKDVIIAASELKLECLSLFAFSSENWQRPSFEVKALTDLFGQALSKEVDKLHENNIQLQFIGDKTRFSKRLQKLMHDAETLSRDNTGLRLVIALNYGGRWDIAQAARSLAEQVAAGQLNPEQIDESCLDQALVTSHLSDPDLLIRSSGEQRISNYYLWQSAYTELYFTDLYWPDFRREALSDALEFYATRKRRFGLIDEQSSRACEPSSRACEQ